MGGPENAQFGAVLTTGTFTPAIAQSPCRAVPRVGRAALEQRHRPEHISYHPDPGGRGQGQLPCPILIKIVVEDNGIGFEERFPDRIFTPFQRLHGRSSQYEGTGMGLAICKKMLERHGGNIMAPSAPGHGATFIITLPSSKPD